MEKFSDQGLVLRASRYGERDKLVVVLGEHQGRMALAAKGAVHSRRFAGSLDLFSMGRFHVSRKGDADLGRLDEVDLTQSFSRLPLQWGAFSAAHVMADFCLKVLEPWTPVREVYLLLYHGLVTLDAAASIPLQGNKDEEALWDRVLAAFLLKACYCLGYNPGLGRCVLCQTSLVDGEWGASGHSGSSHANTTVSRGMGMRWSPSAGGVLCSVCSEQGGARAASYALDPSQWQGLLMLLRKPLREALVMDLHGASSVGRPYMDFIVPYVVHHFPSLQNTGLRTVDVMKAGMSPTLT